MATPIIRFTHILMKENELDMITEQIKQSFKDGFCVLPACVELIGVVQDDGTFMPANGQAAEAMNIYYPEAHKGMLH